jgi:bifunctional UDP-N-acetylglucosamine pyrophosphorylase/glucosamine-1-phosphate N-acetyltransferase
MNTNKNTKLGAVILAAGRGKRMKLKNVNKTSLLLNGKPLISYPVELLKKMKIDPVIIVVGHAKNTVQNALRKSQVIFAEQKKRLGTGHAIKSAMSSIPDTITDILVLNGDDSYFYTQNLLNKMITTHYSSNPSVTLLTIKTENPAGIGRIVRDSQNQVIDIVEEKDASESQKKIKEININCYIFQTKFLRKYTPKLRKSPVTGEYYLPALIKLARDNNEKIEILAAGFIPWQGVNTKEELEAAKKIFKYE